MELNPASSSRSRIPMLAVAALVALSSFIQTDPASASIEFESKWGSAGPANGQFLSPEGVAVDPDGNVYVADDGRHRIQKFSASGKFILKFGDCGHCNGQNLGPGEMMRPVGIATDSEGNVYVTDRHSSRIQKFSPSGVFITQWGEQGSGPGQLDYQNGLAVDSSDNVYVADSGNNRIQKFSSSGDFILEWGGLGSGNAEFSNPQGLTTDSAGNVYVADTFNERIQKFTLAGEFLSKWGSQGSANSQFNKPFNIAVSTSGNVYVLEKYNSRIQEFSSSGEFISKFGEYGSVDGNFVHPTGIATGPSGRLYVTDTDKHQIQVLLITPDTTITSGPSSPTNDPTPAFSFSSPEPGATFECRLGSDPFGPCDNPETLNELPDGSHTLEVRAVSLVGNVDSTPPDWHFVVDTTAPVVTIDSGLSGLTTDTTPTFNFSANETATFECSIDQGVPAFGPCSGPGSNHTPSSGLSEGSYTFRIRATDPATNSSTTTRSFTVDNAPIVTIDSGPVGLTSNATPIFEFSANETATFECSIDQGAPAFGPCTGPGDSHVPALALTDGGYTFRVKATDSVANSTTATRTFTVDKTPPDTIINSGPTGTIAVDQATFTFVGSPANDTAKIRCKIDDQAFADCSSPKTFSSLTDGPHTASFRAEDAVGNQDQSPAIQTFTVDTTPPQVVIDVGPSDPTNDTTPSFEFSVNETSTFECLLYPRGITPPRFDACSGPLGTHTAAGALSEGDYAFEVRATDLAGHSGTTSHIFTVDTTVPDPPGPSAACVAAESDLGVANRMFTIAKRQQMKANRMFRNTKKPFRNAKKTFRNARKSSRALMLKRAKKRLRAAKRNVVRSKKRAKLANRKTRIARQGVKGARAVVADTCP